MHYYTHTPLLYIHCYTYIINNTVSAIHSTVSSTNNNFLRICSMSAAPHMPRWHPKSKSRAATPCGAFVAHAAPQLPTCAAQWLAADAPP